jgi:hypothetical protein
MTTRTPNSVRLLELLQERPQNRVELLAGSGLEHEQVKDALWNLCKRGMASASKNSGELILYEITQKGIYHLKPATDPERIARAQAAYRRKLQRNSKYAAARRLAAGPARAKKLTPIPAPEPSIVQRPIAPPCLTNSIVSNAIQSRPALQAVWC